MYKLCMRMGLGAELRVSFRRAVGEFKWPSLILRDTATSCPGFVWVLSVSSDREVFELLLLWRRPAREGVRRLGAHSVPCDARVWAWLKEDA